MSICLKYHFEVYDFSQRQKKDKKGHKSVEEGFLVKFKGFLEKTHSSILYIFYFQKVEKTPNTKKKTRDGLSARKIYIIDEFAVLCYFCIWFI